MLDNIKVGFIGLGKLGYPCAEIFSEYFDVYGYDITHKQSDRITIVRSIEDCIKASDIVFIAVPTPHDEQYGGSTPVAHLPPKDFDYSVVKSVLRDIDDVIQPGFPVVIISTVLPGIIRSQFTPIVKNARLIYNPFFVAMGSVEEDFLNPEMIIIGTEDGDSAQDAVRLLRKIYDLISNSSRTIVGTWEEAECIKIFYNTFISFKIAFANMILDVSEEVGNINVDVVTKAIFQSKKRIQSVLYTKPGMGDGGPCHPRDNIALQSLSNRLNLGYDLFAALSETREVQAYRLAKYLVSFGNPIVIMGISYKPGVSYTEGSYSLLIGHFIQEMGQSVSYLDPLAQNDKATKLPSGPVTFLLAHNDKWIESFNFPIDAIVVDPWRSYHSFSNIRVIHYGNTHRT